MIDAALERIQQGHPSKALETLHRLLLGHPRHPNIYFPIGTAHAIQGKNRVALEWFDKTLQVYPYSLEALYNEAVARQKLREVGKYIRAYQKVVKYGEPDDDEVHQARSFIQAMSAKIRKVEGLELELYLRSNEHFDQAFELMRAGDWHGALNGFKVSEAIHEKNASCHGNIAICLANLGQKAAALAHLDRALEINPDYEAAIANRKIFKRMEEGTPPHIKTQIINTFD